jgi:hypothetical protein
MYGVALWGAIEIRKRKRPAGGLPMPRFAIVGLALALAAPTLAQEPDTKKSAQEILDKGSAIFDTHDAAAMAATYLEDSRLLITGKNNDTGAYDLSVKEGRSQVEEFYRDLWKDSSEKTTSKNTVEFARFVSPDVLIIYGTFEPNTAKGDKYSFVQTRIKKGDKWLIQTLQLFLV